jgi:hypothetical protein
MKQCKGPKATRDGLGPATERVQEHESSSLGQRADFAFGNATLVVSTDATNCKRLLLLFHVFFELVLNESTVVSVIASNFSSRRFGFAFKLVFCCQHLFATG